jgi:hypothetical protein
MIETRMRVLAVGQGGVAGQQRPGAEIVLDDLPDAVGAEVHRVLWASLHHASRLA